MLASRFEEPNQTSIYLSSLSLWVHFSWPFHTLTWEKRDNSNKNIRVMTHFYEYVIIQILTYGMFKKVVMLTIRIFPYFPGKLLPCPLYENRWELYGYLKIVKWPLKSTLTCTILHVHCTCTHIHSTWTSKVHVLCRKFNGMQKCCKIRKNIARIHKTQTGGWQLCNYSVGLLNCACSSIIHLFIKAHS